MHFIKSTQFVPSLIELLKHRELTWLCRYGEHDELILFPLVLEKNSTVLAFFPDNDGKIGVLYLTKFVAYPTFFI